jgi:Xaa-Pro aminopeptidase
VLNEIELFHVRIALIQAFLRNNKYDGVLLNRPDNFAMATGGKRSYIYMFSDVGACSLFVSKDGKAYFVGNTIEEPRMMAEEIGVLGVDTKRFLWFESSPAAVVKKEFSGELVSDDGSIGKNVNGELAPLRALLTETELEKYRRIGAFGAESIQNVIDSIKLGDLESDIASRIIAEGTKRRCMVPVALVAADERIARFRHPLPTADPLISGSLAEIAVKGYVMIVGCFHREGLVVSMTRFKRVGDVSGDIPAAFDRICAVDAIMQETSVAGKTVGDVFAACQKAYADLGFPANEWHNHHQGGLTGYAGRTIKGAPGVPFPILDQSWAKKVKDISGIDTAFGHAFAWNPSAKGVKSEDTFILPPDGTHEIVTSTPKIPKADVARVLGRPCGVVKSGIAS